MKITPISHGLDLLASNLVRSPGLHVSDIYGDFFQALEPNRYKSDKPNPLLLALGTAWEHHLEFLLDKNGLKVIRPGELFTPEGIAYSPDGLLTGEDRLVEYKLSSMGTKDLPTDPASRFHPKFDKWVYQMATYCHHLETPRARLYFCSIYSPRAPQLVTYDIEFTVRELQEYWNTLRNHARNRGML